MNKTKHTLLLLTAILFLSACDSLKKSKSNDTKRPVTERQEGTTNTDTKAENTADEKISATSSDMKMIDEINLLRKNPKGYVKHINSYLSYFEKGNFPSLGTEKRTADELIRQLENMTPLTELNYHEDLYLVAKEHGKFLKERGNIFSESPHKGRGGSTPEKRISRGTDLRLFAENFGSGHASPRYQLISLLVDAGITGRGHRVNILDPRWNVVACYNIGTIGADPGCWLQLFGYEENSENESAEAGPKVTLKEVNKLVDRATYMKLPEREMLHEINLLRSNPGGYTQHIENYIKKVEKGEIFTMVPADEEVELAEELMRDLRKMKPLSLLKPDLKLYNVATAHGDFLRKKGKPEMNPNPHAGRNGKGAYERIVEGANMSKGGENYQATYLSVRETVIGLLIDSGIPGFGHRKTLLNPAWDHGVCHDFGPVNTAGGVTIPHNWLQNFAKR